MITIQLLLCLCVAGVCYGAVSHNVGINGGHRITIEEAPFMVSLRLDKTHHWCGGSIVHDSFILTAAHCIKPNHAYDVMVGTDLIDGTDGEYHDIENYVVHHKYNETTLDFNVALIKLSKPVQLGPKAKIIELADRTVELPTGILLNMTGWGQPKIEDFSDHLLQVTVPVVARHSCQDFYKDKDISENMVCAGTKGKNVSFGDTGGPLTLGNVQVGVSSFGRGHGKVPSVYTKIRKVHKWIEIYIRKNSNNQ